MRQGDDKEFFDILCRMRLGIQLDINSKVIIVRIKGEYTEDDEQIIKSRSIRKQDNPEHYQQRLKELQSEEFVNAIYAYSVRSKTNERNAIKLKETATTLKKPIWLIQAIDVGYLHQRNCVEYENSLLESCNGSNNFLQCSASK